MTVTLRNFAILVTLIFSVSAARQHQSAIKLKVSPAEAQQIGRFELAIDRLREELRIPAISATIVRNQQVLWARGFGYADLEHKIPATEHTSYHLASLTKTFTSNILMNLIHDGKVNLDDPVSKYGIAIESNGVVRVRHIFSHTSEGNPGERYSYNSGRYSELQKVVEKTTGSSFADLAVKNILIPLGMEETTPNALALLSVQPVAGEDTASVGELRHRTTALFNAYNEGNADAVMRLSAKGSTVFEADGEFLIPFVNPKELANLFHSGLKFAIEPHYVQVDVRGMSAVVTCYERGTVVSASGHSRPYGPFRATFVWSKESDGWKIIHAHHSPLTTTFITESILERFQHVLPNMALPYVLDSTNHPVRGIYPASFGVSAGMISSVTDMARYDIALDQSRILDRKTQQLAWTPAISTRGDTLPYGLGWFTTAYRSIKLIWHYGWWDCNSSLILKVPQKNITFIVMANTDNLSRSTNLGAGDLTSSPLGLEFLKHFVLPDLFGEELAEIDWKAADAGLKAQMKKLSAKPYGDLVTVQLLNQARIFASVGETEKAGRLFRLYAESHGRPLPFDLSKQTTIASITEVTNNEDRSATFTIPQSRSVRIFALGEAFGGQMVDRGWIEEAATHAVLWEMKPFETAPAGGDEKNRVVDTLISIPAGTYAVRYKSDESHSYNHWNTLPPDYDFWGIVIFSDKK